MKVDIWKLGLLLVAILLLISIRSRKSYNSGISRFADVVHECIIATIQIFIFPLLTTVIVFVWKEMEDLPLGAVGFLTQITQWGGLTGVVWRRGNFWERFALVNLSCAVIFLINVDITIEPTMQERIRAVGEVALLTGGIAFVIVWIVEYILKNKSS